MTQYLIGDQDAGAEILIQPLEPRRRNDDIAHRTVLIVCHCPDTAEEHMPTVQADASRQPHRPGVAIELLRGAGDFECRKTCLPPECGVRMGCRPDRKYSIT